MKPADLLPPEIAEEDPLLDSAADLERSARALDLEYWIEQRLKHAEREITLNLSLPRDSGEIALQAAYRVQHFRPPVGCLGPVLLAPDAHLAQLRQTALRMTLQCALLDLPLGGSAGAIVCDPAQLSEREIRHLARHYAAALRDFGPDIFAPAEPAAGWTSRHLEPAMIVGKPAILGGLLDPAAAIACGWQTLITEQLATGPLPLATVSLQGFSPAAAALAHLLHASGARVIALADKSGGLFSDRGLDLAAISAHVAEHGMLYGFAGAEPVRNSDVLESACDLLITAAAERQINALNACRIRAPLIMEALPNAITPVAKRALTDRGIAVIPDLLGAAPVTLAWFCEWQHAAQHAILDQTQVESFIRDQIARAFHRVQHAAAAHKASLPDACRMLALERLASILRLTR